MSQYTHPDASDIISFMRQRLINHSASKHTRQSVCLFWKLPLKQKYCPTVYWIWRGTGNTETLGIPCYVVFSKQSGHLYDVSDDQEVTLSQIISKTKVICRQRRQPRTQNRKVDKKAMILLSTSLWVTVSLTSFRIIYRDWPVPKQTCFKLFRKTLHESF